jgi:HK97 family phage major capsid protein
MTVKDLTDKRLKAITDARAILDAAGDKGLSTEDATKYDAFMSEADKLKGQIERASKLEAAEREAEEVREQRDEQEKREAEARNRAPRVVTQSAEPVSRVELPFVLPDAEEVRRREWVKTDEYRTAFAKGLRFGTDVLNRDEKRALSVGTDTTGGYLVPDEFERTLLQDLVVPTVVRQRATVLTSVSGDRQIPFVSSHGSASWTGEAKAFSESDEVFGLKTIGAHKLTRLVKVSMELMQDSVFDLEAYLRDEFGRSFNAAEDTAFVSGNGAGRPRGFIVDTTSGVTAAATTSITADELIDLYHALSIPHRSNATFVLADATLKGIRKLKTGDGQYLWVPGLQSGQSDTLLGRPVVVSDDMPAMTTGLKAVAFINFRYYYIVDRAGFYLQLLRELYAANGQVGFVGYKRTDGRLILDAAARCITMA